MGYTVPFEGRLFLPYLPGLLATVASVGVAVWWALEIVP